MGIEIVDFKKYQKNTLRGFLTLRLTTIGLEIRDATVHEKDRDRWIGLPARPYEKEDGSTGYSYIIKFVDKDRWNQFQAATLEALEEYLPARAEKVPDEDISF